VAVFHILQKFNTSFVGKEGEEWEEGRGEVQALFQALKPKTPPPPAPPSTTLSTFFAFPIYASPFPSNNNAPPPPSPLFPSVLQYNLVRLRVAFLPTLASFDRIISSHNV